MFFKFETVFVPISLLILLLMQSTRGENVSGSVLSFDNISPSSDQLSKDPKITGGSPLPTMYAVHLASVRLKQDEKHGFGFGYQCGGSVISQRVVLTAAHCLVNEYFRPIRFRDAREFTLVMGTVNRFKRDDKTLQYDVLQVLPHAAFNYTSYDNDIALMFINGYIPWNWPTVQSIELEKKAAYFDIICSVQGWGATPFELNPSVLIVGLLPILSDDKCSSYDGMAINKICAGTHTSGVIVNACETDGGSPLQCDNMLTGIVSRTNNCFSPPNPGLYTNVSYFNEWIVSNNATFNYAYYTYYRGNAPSISGQSGVFILFVTFCSIVIGSSFRQ